MSDFGYALELMGIGMVTVFIILLLVVSLGNLIIWFVNRYVPEEVKSVAKTVSSESTDTNRKKVVAIVSAVNIITRGRGRVTNIEKV